MTRRDGVLAAAVFLIALALRLYDLGYPSTRTMDEVAHVPAAVHYWSDGQFEPDFWEHPPLRHLMLYGFLQVFGDGPTGWRLRNVLFGALAAALTYVLARQVGGGPRTALLAGVLLATDPLHVVLSRYTYEEIYGGALFLAAIVVYLGHRGRCAWFAASALLMGLALATKWYYVPSWLLLGVLAVRGAAGRPPGTRTFLLTTWTLVPVAVYLLSFYPWFGRGYALDELGELTVNAYHSLQAASPLTFGPDLVFLSHSSAWEWFTRPIVLGQGTYLSGGRGEFVLFTNDFPIWVLALPALLASAVVAARRRELGLALPALIFCATYALFLGVRRPVFVYSAAPLLPFAFTAIAWAVRALAARIDGRDRERGPEAVRRGGTALYAVALASAVAWNAYLYPVVTAKKVPVAAYRRVVERESVRLLP